MAVLSAFELAVLRRGLADLRGGVVDWTKPQANAMFQAIEDSLVLGGSAASAINTSIEGSAAAGVFSAAEKVAATKCVLRKWGL